VFSAFAIKDVIVEKPPSKLEEDEYGNLFTPKKVQPVLSTAEIIDTSPNSIGWSKMYT